MKESRILKITVTFIYVALFALSSIVFLQNSMVRWNGDSSLLDLYQIYVSSDTELYGDTTYGKYNAKISIVMLVDYESESYKHFVENLLPDLKRDYLDTGVARLFIREYISLSDIESDRFKYSNDNNIINVESLIGSEKTMLNDALRHENRMQGISPVMYIGVAGRYNEVLYGVSSFNKIARIIKEKQLTIGGAV